MKASAAIRREGRSPRALLSYLGRRLLLPLARARRRRLRETLVVAVTGSAGKTTAKRMIDAVLRAKLPGRASYGTRNRVDQLLVVLARARRNDRYLAVELGAKGPGSLDELLWTLEPDVGVVTAVGSEHRAAFGTLEATASEKAKLVAWLPPSGLAVLNADDPLVLEMRTLSSARTVLVGTSPTADLRAEEVESSWPETLRFTVCRGEERVAVVTRLHGVHWVPSALAALAVGLEAGVPLVDGTAALSKMQPERHRLSEVRLAGGITVLEDDWKAPEWNVELAIDVVRRARAPRKVVVLGQMSDARRSLRRLYREVAARWLEVADVLIVVGRLAEHARPVAGARGALHVVASARAAHELLQRLLRPGDLVLVKSNIRPLHLERLVLARQDGQLCWRTDCKLQVWCHDCDRRFRPERHHALDGASPPGG